MIPGRRTRVLIVDDSAIVRRVLSDILASEPDIEVVGTAPDPYIARDKILTLQPDVVTLDIEMPRMDGLTFLAKLMEHRPMPVVIISSLAQASCEAALEAARRGAVDVLAKPGGPYSVSDLKGDLPRRIRAAAQSRPRRTDHCATQPAAPAVRPSTALRAHEGNLELIALGASTGGTQAIEAILTSLPEEMPPIAVVQHIPPVFSAAFARRLDSTCRLKVREATDGEPFRRGNVLVAPGNFHLTVERVASGLVARLNQNDRVCYQRPAVDVLFRSVAQTAGSRAAAALLTGMGRDGAEGMAALRKAGAMTIAQDEASCVVFGMPREAIRLGAAAKVLPLEQVASHLLVN